MIPDDNLPPPGWLMTLAVVLILFLAGAGLLVRVAWEILAWLVKLA